LNHRIHVKKAIRKNKQCHIFDQNIPVSMLGVLNQGWAIILAWGPLCKGCI